jgi:hypothetical protein
MFTEARQDNRDGSVTQTESTNYLTQHCSLTGDEDKMKSQQQTAENNRNMKCSVKDTTHDREGREVHVSAVETYPKTPHKFKHQAADVTVDINNKSPSCKCIPHAEIMQVQNTMVCNRQSEKQALDSFCKEGAQCRKSTALQELQDDQKETNKDNKRRLLNNSSQKQVAQGREKTEVQELEDNRQSNKDSKITLPENSSSQHKTNILEIEDAYTENNKNDMRLLNNSPKKHEIQGTEMMKLWKVGYNHKESNKDYETQPVKDTSVKAQGRGMMHVQELGYDYKANSKGNLVRLVDDYAEKCQAHCRETMKAQELGAAYKGSELQGDDKHVSSSATLTKISSVREEIVRTKHKVNVFKSEGQLRYKATDQNKEFPKQKMPTLETNCDNGELVEKAITEEVNSDTKEPSVMEHNETQNMVKTTEMSVQAQNKDKASAVQIKRYINTSLELQIINQDK